MRKQGRPPRPSPATPASASLLPDNTQPSLSAVSLPSVTKKKFFELYATTVGKNSNRSRDESCDSEDGDERASKKPRNLLQQASNTEEITAVEEASRPSSRPSSEDWSMPTDTMVALEMMCAQFPKMEKTMLRPFVLRSQLYSSVNDRTIVDRELEVLRLQQVVRTFKLSTGQDDYTIMFLADYLSLIEAAKKRLARKNLPMELAIFYWFKAHVIPSHLDASIAHSQLMRLLSEGGSAKESHVSLLMNAGLLVRQLVDETSYWFSIPNVGFVLKSLSKGRQEVLSFLTRRRYREMSQGPLERRLLRYSQLGMRFHLRDLLGLGKIHVIPSPSGPQIRLARD